MADVSQTKKTRRKRILLGIAIGLSLLGLVGLARTWARGTLTGAERTSPEGLAPGRVESRLIEREGEKWVQLSGIIEAPIAQVWKVVHDHERMSQFMPRMSRLQVLEKTDGHRKVRIDFSFLWIERFTEIDVTAEILPDHRIERWDRYGGTLPVNRGRWLLVPLDGQRTFARYEVDSDSGLWIPRWLDRALLRDALPVILTRVNERIQFFRTQEPSYLDTAE